MIAAYVLVVAGAFTFAGCVLWSGFRPRHGRHEARELAGEAEADTFVAELRGDRFDAGVYLPRTLPPAGRTPWQPAGYALAAVDKHYPPDDQAGCSDPPAESCSDAGLPGLAERLATDTDVRCAAPAHPRHPEPQPGPCAACAACGDDENHAQGVIPAWVIAALGGHTGPDAAVESIVARADAVFGGAR